MEHAVILEFELHLLPLSEGRFFGVPRWGTSLSWVKSLLVRAHLIINPLGRQGTDILMPAVFQNLVALGQLL